MLDWLIQARQDKGLTQQDVAEKAGITRQMLSAIELGKAKPSVKAAKAIADVIGSCWTRFYG